MKENPKPRWFALAERFFPSRCREIPEAQNPDRIVLRQFALVGRHVYLQQFASSEDERFMHSHQWRRTIAIGLRGWYTEHRMAGEPRLRIAPYFYTMDASVIHRVEDPSPNHTSIFIGIGRDDDLKKYFGSPVVIDPKWTVAGAPRVLPRTLCSTWEAHVKRMVARI